MNLVLIGIGSNIAPTKYIPAALLALNQAFGPLTCSSIYVSEAVGFSGPPFQNLAVRFKAACPASDLADKLKIIEQDLGRPRSPPVAEVLSGLQDRTIDLDLLLYGDEVLRGAGLTLPRPELLTQPFALGPAAEIAGEVCPPGADYSLAEHWSSMGQTLQVLVSREAVRHWLAASPARHAVPA